MMPLNLPKAVLFDNDGVLIESEKLHAKAWVGFLSQFPFDLKAKEEDLKAHVVSMVGRAAPKIMASLLDRYSPGWDPAAHVLEDYASAKNVIYRSLLATELMAYPKVREFILFLKSKGVKVAVVSNAKRTELSMALTVTGLLPLFDKTYSRDEVAKPKPDPGAYLTAVYELGLEPKDCWVIEDSPTGIESGLMAGIPSIALLTNFKREAMESPIPGRADLKPFLVLDSIETLFQSVCQG